MKLFEFIDSFYFYFIKINFTKLSKRLKNV